LSENFTKIRPGKVELHGGKDLTLGNDWATKISAKKTTPKLGPTAMPAENRVGRREVISKPGKGGKRPGLRPGVTA